jgi:hypothetical protein
MEQTELLTLVVAVEVVVLEELEELAALESSFCPTP